MKKLLLISLAIFFTLNSNISWSSEYDTNPGFRDLRPGMLVKDFNSHCSGRTCYKIKNIKFFKEYDNKFIIHTVILDMGPIVSSDGSFFSTLNNRVVSSDDEPNIYLKMKKNFDAKYVLDYEYSERDRQLFNEDEKKELLGVYSNGQVASKISRKESENSYSKDLWLYIEYRDIDSAKSFLKINRPVTATLDDF